MIRLHNDEEGHLVIDLEHPRVRRYRCLGSGRRTGRLRDRRVRTWDDLPWAEHPVTLRYAVRRVRCRRCGIRS